jgi:hypothetical protein
MGLTIYYGLKAKIGVDAARKVVARMHQRIAKLPCPFGEPRLQTNGLNRDHANLWR